LVAPPPDKSGNYELYFSQNAHTPTLTRPTPVLYYAYLIYV
jgi:hypothetical protein